MNEEKFKYIYSFFKNLKVNDYEPNSPMDHFEITKNEVEKLNVSSKVVIERNKRRLYLSNNNECFYRYTKSFYPNNSLFGIKVANNKLKSEEYLKYGNIKTTESEVFRKNQYKDAYQLILESKEKKVLKPLGLDGGLGVFINVTTLNFDYAWNECIKAQEQRNIKEPVILLQNQVDGFEVRMIVTAGMFSSATLRIPAHIIGDGKNSIEDLIKVKNIERQRNPLLKKYPIKINKKLEKLLSFKNKNLSTVLDEFEPCILFPQSNTQYGGENIECTKLISNELKNSAKKLSVLFQVYILQR